MFVTKIINIVLNGRWAVLKIVNRPQRCSAYNIDMTLEIIRKSDEIYRKWKNLNMMFLEDGGNGHYMYIKNISR